MELNWTGVLKFTGPKGWNISTLFQNVAEQLQKSLKLYLFTLRRRHQVDSIDLSFKLSYWLCATRHQLSGFFSFSH